MATTKSSTNKGKTLRVASCQFPVTKDIRENARHIRRYLLKAYQQGAHLLHTSEASLTGYAGTDFRDLRDMDWDLVRAETDALRALCRELSMWLVLGSSHRLGGRSKPTNCLYLIDTEGAIVERYDKRMLTPNDRIAYSAGDHFSVTEVRGVKVGLAICFDACSPQIYAAYRDSGAELILHSFNNGSYDKVTCLAEMVRHQIPTRCADNLLWAIANNNSKPESNWGSFVARPDCTIAQSLPKNRSGMLIHEFPDGLSENGWTVCDVPMKLAEDQQLSLGRVSSHIRRKDVQAEP